MRTATVTYSLAECAIMLRLRGKWLEHAGFQEGQRVQIDVTHGKLTLTVPEGTESLAHSNRAASHT
jgi:hypothetical protein